MEGPVGGSGRYGSQKWGPMQGCKRKHGGGGCMRGLWGATEGRDGGAGRITAGKGAFPPSVGLTGRRTVLLLR